MTHTNIRRPDPMRWFWYTFGGSLGPRYREWVLDDLTSRTRWVRHVARSVVQVAPVGALVIVALGFSWITGVALICGLLLSLMYSVAFFNQSAEHRLLQHGFPWGTARRIVIERDRAKDPDRMRRYMQTYRNGATT